jgi:N-acetylmuramoyl-L-alanine amidase
MKLIISAGHSPRTSGAFALGTKEYDLNYQIARGVFDQLKVDPEINVELLSPMLSLSDRVKYLKSLPTGSFLAIEFHHNVFNSKARGSEVYYKAGDKQAFDFGKKLLEATCERTGLKNRGMKLASASARGSLAWVGTQGCLLWEICFMDNREDLALVYNECDTFVKTVVEWIKENPR